MNQKYFVISKSGEIVDPKKYVESEECSEEFAIVIKREAFNEGVNRGEEVEKSKSDYLAIAKKLGFSWEQNSEGGFVSYDYRAKLIMNLVQEYAKQLVRQIGFPVFEVSGANFFDMSYPVVQAYAGLYGDRLFQFKLSDKALVMSYDASYPQFNLAGSYSMSYKQLPFAHFSISDCYRNEQSGELMLFYRQRRFYMPDLHPYFKDVAEAFAWYPKIQEQLIQVANGVNRHFHVIAEVSSPAYWEHYQKEVVSIAKELGQEMLVIVDDGSKDYYWIINVDYKIVDQLQQSREIACIQIDVGNAKRLGIEYADKEGKKINPVIIHSAVPGGIERFIYMLIDNFVGSFPLWLYPAQIRLLPVSDKHIKHCLELAEKYKSAVRIEVDDRQVGVNSKVKKAHDDLIPHQVVIGDKELSNGNEALEKVVKSVIESSENKPFLPMPYPILLSQQVV